MHTLRRGSRCWGMRAFTVCSPPHGRAVRERGRSRRDFQAAEALAGRGPVDPGCPCPAAGRVGESKPSARGQLSLDHVGARANAGGPAQALAPALSVELASCAGRAVRKRLPRLLVAQVDAPALGRLDPQLTALETGERSCRDRACGGFLRHRLVASREMPSIRVVTADVQRLWIAWKVWKLAERGGPTLECGHPRSRPMMMSDVPLAA